MPEQAITTADLDVTEATGYLQRADDLPDFRVPLLNGGDLASRSLIGRRSLIFMFDPISQACVDLLPELAALHVGEGTPHVVMISRRDPELTNALGLLYDMPYSIGVQTHWDVSRLFGPPAAPLAFVVAPAGYLETDVAIGQQAVQSLLKRLRPEPVQRRLTALASLVR